MVVEAQGIYIYVYIYIYGQQLHQNGSLQRLLFCGIEVSDHKKIPGRIRPGLVFLGSVAGFWIRPGKGLRCSGM